MVDKLQELCVARNWSFPIYELTGAEGPSHMPKFLMRCKVQDFVAIGSGGSKRIAKLDAAQKLLHMISRRVERRIAITAGTHTDTESLVEEISTILGKTETSKATDRTEEIHHNGDHVNVPMSSVDGNLGRFHYSTGPVVGEKPNLVGKLQEICVAKHFPLPLYDLIGSHGPSHLPQFVMRCSVKDYVAIAAGGSKKEAKHNAAQKILAMIEKGVKHSSTTPVVSPTMMNKREMGLPTIVQTVFVREITETECAEVQHPCITKMLDYTEIEPLCITEILEDDEMETLPPSEVKENIEEPIKEPLPLPSLEDTLCARFQSSIIFDD